MCPTKHFAKIDITTRNMTGSYKNIGTGVENVCESEKEMLNN